MERKRMQEDTIKRIARQFRLSGHEIYEVGGSVRDSLLGIEPKGEKDDLL